MSKRKLAAVALSVLVGVGILATPAPQAQAKDDLYMLDIATAMKSADVTDALDNSVRFYFGDQHHPAIAKDYGTYVTNKKANGVGKSDEVSCTRAFASAMITLRDRAKKLGANAVVDIRSYFKKKESSSMTQVECYSGLLMVGVALKARFVKL